MRPERGQPSGLRRVAQWAVSLGPNTNVYLSDYATPREARQGLGRYLEFHNQERPHQSLAYRTPAEVYFAPVRALSGGEMQRAGQVVADD